MKMSDNEAKEVLSMPSLEDSQENPLDHFESGEKIEKTLEDGKNVPFADLGPENQETANFLDGEPHKRERKLTEKGRAYEIEKLDRKRHNAYTAMSKQIKEIRQSLNDVDLKALEVERDQLDKLKEAFNEAQRAFDDMLDTEESKQASYHWFDFRDRECVECRMKITERIRILEKSLFKANSVKSGLSNPSRHSSKISRGSSGRSRRIDAAAKSARLKAEMQNLGRVFLSTILE